MKALAWRNGMAGGLLLLALTQMAADLAGAQTLKGLAAMTVASPCPKVFCKVQGFEPFASTFQVSSGSGPTQRQILVTPEVYQQVRGPYNRRNAYGAALAFAPRLPERLRTAVFHYGLCGEAPLRRELRLAEEAGPLTVTISTNTRGSTDRWTYTSCTH